MKFVGYDACPIAVAKTLIVLAALSSPESVTTAIEIWFSSTWSNDTMLSFKKSLHTVLLVPSLQESVRNVLVAWKDATPLTNIQAIHELRKVTNSYDASFEMCFNLAHEEDRYDMARIIMRGAFSTSTSNHKFGNIPWFNTPKLFGESNLCEFALFVFPM